MQLRIDDWTGQLNKSQEIADPDPDKIEAAIACLDGWNRTQVTMQADDDRLLMIGGGPDTYLVQYLLPEDQGEWLAQSTDALEGYKELAIGRQRADYPKRNLVSTKIALAAALSFLENGGRSPDVDWSRSF